MSVPSGVPQVPSRGFGLNHDTDIDTNIIVLEYQLIYHRSEQKFTDYSNLGLFSFLN